MNANLAQKLADAAARHPQRPAVYLGQCLVADYRELARRAARGAAGLRGQLGLQRDERVALAMRNGPEYVELLYAIWHAGLCAVPINARLHPREMAHIVEDCGARVCFTSDVAPASTRARSVAVSSAAYAALFSGPDEQAEPECRQPDDLAWIFYTSGTTGTPKGAMLSHGNLAAMARAYAAAVSTVEPGDRLIHAAPMSHGSGLYIVPYLDGGAAQVIPPSRGFDPAEMAELIEAHDQCCVFAAPTMLQRLVGHLRASGQPLEGLKVLVCGGAPLYAEDARDALACIGPRMAQIYGQGESPMTIAAQSTAELAVAYAAGRTGAVGRAMPSVRLRIADDVGRPLPAGQTGEVLVRGPTVMRGYWNNPAATAAAMRGGWLHTGDLGSVDGDGNLCLLDRSNDVIISGGSNIYPREIEDVLLAHPRVAEVCVVGRRHPLWGEEVVAFVVPQPAAPPSPKELDDWCLAQVARFKRPRHYHLVEALPKNAYGKVLRRTLRESPG